MNRNIATSFIFGLCFFSSAYSASLPEFIELSEVKISKPFPYNSVVPDAMNSMADQLGFYTFEASNTSNSKLPFPLYQVAINYNSKFVYYVRATKPYPQIKLCLESLKDLTNNLSTAYGTSMKDLKLSKLVKKSGDINIEATCSVGISPYAELSLVIESESQRKEIERVMKKRYAH